ncbi:DUF2975 domain-containing protein [Croceicoccus pelagius]|uniref:DUF2975 domain-containing protein n=1 Tax=Croceicoccus pelagius TaxID=1703341 RepID=A0A917DMH6_9SPHN|nr:DUF2975 domain-containing protein [Croceicoccus pelagius]GGD50605.1 hypothetical protein GCM10010989_26010 [Croceicoccus pelagius]
MSLKRIDPLLAIARVILIIIQVITGLAAVICTVAVPAIFLFRAQIIAELNAEGVVPDALPVLAGMAGLGAIVLGMVFVVTWLCRRIVNTVGEGDPFVPENATRLARMAWLMLAIQIISLPLSAGAVMLEQMTEGNTIEGDGISLSAILLVIILFVLARVFRKGTEMRADLEGTV